MMKKCPYCKTLIDDDALFCTECGQKIEKTKYCINCGKEIEVDSAFCPYCGVPQQDEERHEDIPKKDENDIIINVNPVDVRQKTKRGKKTNILSIVIPLIGVVCAVCAFFFLLRLFYYLY